MARIIVDTSSILFGISCRKDVFAIASRSFRNATITVSKGVIRELSGISKNRGVRGSTAKAALALIRVKNVKVDTDNGSVDSWILRIAARHNNSIVITNDTALFKKAESANPNVFKLSKSGLLRR